MNKKPAQYQMVYGNAANMNIIRSGEADLILTGPPYFSKETELLLEKPTAQQNQLDHVRREITSFAMGMRPVYEEIERILKPDGVLVVQIKDIRYHRVLIDLTNLHRQMIEALGFLLVTRIYWHKKNKRSRALKFRDKPVVGAFRADDVEDVLVFSRSDIAKEKGTMVDLTKAEIDKCWQSPLWDMAPAGRNRKHPHQSPETLIRRIIALYSKPGDLVVDPFAGGGTILKVAVEMDRRAIGYEIVDHYAKTADSVAEASLKHKVEK
jgi:DNA modification methylase